MTIPPPDPAQPSDLNPSPPSPPITFGSILVATTPRVYVIWIIIAANIAVYLAMCFTGVNWWFPAISSMEKWGADSWQLTTSGQWWRLFTSAFLHFGLLHLVFNMWALMQVGELTERLFGNFVFALIYIFTALLSGLSSTWWDKMAVSAGASGAIFGVYGALLAYIIFQRRSFPPAAVKSLAISTLIFIGYNVFAGLATPGISNAAHLGGLAGGLFLGAIAARPIMPDIRARQALPRLAALLIVGAGAVALGVIAIPRFANSAEAKLLAAEARLLVLERHFSEQESSTIEIFKSLLNQRSANKLTDQQFSDAIERQIIAGWNALEKEATSLDPGPNKSQQAQRYNILIYSRLRQKGFSLIADGNRTGNKAKIASGMQLMSDAVKGFEAAENPPKTQSKP